MRDSGISGGAAGPRRPALVRIAVLLVVALLAFAALQRVLPDPVAPAPARAAAMWGPPGYADALDVLERDVTREQARVAADPQSWMRWEALAMVLHARGQLTGSYTDLAGGLEAAAKARTLAPDGSGPVLAHAIVALSMHRNDIAADEVARMAGFAVPAPAADQSEAEAILGDVALYGGDYPAALARYRAAEALQPGPGTAVRLADWHRHMGDFAKARSLLDGALEAGGTTPWTRASLLLQRGAIELQTGHWDLAKDYYRRADAAFPGWWLAQAHLAQMAAVGGDLATAEQLYRDILAEAERPAVLDALAAVLHHADRADEALALEQRARIMWEQQAAGQPAAYADHTMDAAMRAGDTARAQQFAALNYRARPYGDARIGLARAAVARGRDQSARAILEELDRTNWRSVEQYRVLADICERSGDAACRDRARSAALAINPLAFDERTDLLFFGNH